MDASKQFFTEVERLEGRELEAYQDEKGIWTIGVGHTKNVKKGDVITNEQCNKYLLEDTRFVENCLDNCGLQLSQNQFDALALLVFNIGETQFRSSTVCRLLKLKACRKDIENAWELFQKVRIGPTLVKSRGLLIRRKFEYSLFFKS